MLGRVKNFSVGICDGAPSTARFSYFYIMHLLINWSCWCQININIFETVAYQDLIPNDKRTLTIKFTEEILECDLILRYDSCM